MTRAVCCRASSARPVEYSQNVPYHWRRCGDNGRERLDRNRPAEASVDGLVDLAHATRAQRRQDFIRAETGTGRQPHCGKVAIISSRRRGATHDPAHDDLRTGCLVAVRFGGRGFGQGGVQLANCAQANKLPSDSQKTARVVMW